MKSIHKVLSSIALSVIFTLSLALSASAQHDHSSGGGGGGHSGGGGGGSVSRPAPAGGGNGGGHVSVAPSRPGYSGHTVGQPQRTNTNSNVSRPTTIGRPNFGQRSGATSVSTTPQYGGHVIGGGQRVGVTSTYRTYGGSVYGHNHPGSGYVTSHDHYHGYLPGNTYYHYNRGYYGTYYRPRLGFAIGVLPYGYYPFYWGDYEYFYSDGLFYQYDDNQYTVVEPPVGAEVTSLPANAQSIVINGQQYYEVNGVYYKPITKDDGTLVYEVAGKDGELNTDDGGDDSNMAPAAPQIGDVVQQLPQGSRKLNINGQVMYMSPDGAYYQSFTDQGGNIEYKIVGLPDDSDNNGDQGGQ